MLQVPASKKRPKAGSWGGLGSWTTGIGPFDSRVAKSRTQAMGSCGEMQKGGGRKCKASSAGCVHGSASGL